MSKDTHNALKAAHTFLTHKGYEIIEENWQPDEDDSVYIIACDADETLVLCDIIASSKDLPGERVGSQVRTRRERAAAQYLRSRSDCSYNLVGSFAIRFDEIAVLLLGDKRALIRHKIGCANE